MRLMCRETASCISEAVSTGRKSTLSGTSSAVGALRVRNNAREYYGAGMQSVLGHAFRGGGSSLGGVNQSGRFQTNAFQNEPHCSMERLMAAESRTQRNGPCDRSHRERVCRN